MTGVKPACTRWNDDGRLTITSVRLRRDAFNELDRIAQKAHVSMAVVIRTAVDEWLAQR